jgi:hypothetical protein
MADTTSRYSWPFQEETDAPNGPTLGQGLAEAAETTVGTIDDRLTALETIVANRQSLTAQLTADGAAITTSALVSVLSVTLPVAGTYEVRGILTLTNVTTAGRPGFAFGGTSTPTAWAWGGGAVHYNTATGSQGAGTSGTTYPSAGHVITNNDWTTTTGWSFMPFTGTVTVSAPGTFTIRLSQTVGSGAVSARRGSMVSVQLIS